MLAFTTAMAGEIVAQKKWNSLWLICNICHKCVVNSQVSLLVVTWVAIFG